MGKAAMVSNSLPFVNNGEEMGTNIEGIFLCSSKHFILESKASCCKNEKRKERADFKSKNDYKFEKDVGAVNILGENNDILTKEIVGRGGKRGRLYHLEDMKSSVNLIQGVSNNKNKVVVWHKRNAFLHGDLDEEIYMDIPPGYDQKDDGKITVLIIYVDYMINTGDNKLEITDLEQKLSREFEMKDLGGLKYFFGIEVARCEKGIFLSQQKYILDLLAEVGMLDCKPEDTPSVPNLKLGDELDQAPTNKERQFMKAPKVTYMDAVMHIISYLKGAPGSGIQFTKNEHLKVTRYTDADWAGSKIDRKSQVGSFTFVGGNLNSGLNLQRRNGSPL
uniref:Putative RNA-directed DNA polymerase n=1 Tax=Tanacetum cinerariifolium TaxID=118510 RepID=A0A6L2LMB6_TANCI|nr:putative RNA-directed DNA polymerase [Tanacetum cinerariifolium]